MKHAKNKTVAAFVALCLVAILVPTASRAVVVRQFIAINDTLLPFAVDNMPDMSGGAYFVPHRVFRDAGLQPFTNVNDGWAMLYSSGKWVYFYTQQGVTKDQNENTINWPAAHRVDTRFYVPLKEVCEFFGLTYDIIEVSRDIIPDEQMVVVRIKSSAAVYSDRAFIYLNRDALRTAYNDYYHPSPPSPTDTGSRPTGATPGVPPPTYRDVTMYLSFYAVSGGSAVKVVDTLADTAGGFHACFFVSGDDIKADPGLIRHLAGSGHTLGLWLEEGTYDEYLRVSALLFEAAKVKTILVSAGVAETGGDDGEGTPDAPDVATIAREMADVHGLLFWDATLRFETAESLTGGITEAFPTIAGERGNLLLECSAVPVGLLPGILAHLSEFEYATGRISETTKPV